MVEAEVVGPRKPCVVPHLEPLHGWVLPQHNLFAIILRVVIYHKHFKGDPFCMGVHRLQTIQNELRSFIIYNNDAYVNQIGAVELAAKVTRRAEAGKGGWRKGRAIACGLFNLPPFTKMVICDRLNRQLGFDSQGTIQQVVT